MLTSEDDSKVWPRELPALKPSAHAEFEAYAEALLVEWLRRQSLPKTRRAYSANAWFKREAYKLIKHVVEGGKLATLERIAQKDERSNRLIQDALRNPFKLGLLAMFADDSPLSRQDRNVFGNQMLFGWAHDVPPDFLNAFLAVSGGPAMVAKKLREKTPEPGFEHRFIVSRIQEAT